MNVVQAVPGLSAESSGPSYSVPALCDGLIRNGCDVSLAFAGAIPRRDFPCEIINAPISRIPHPRLGRSPELLQALKAAVADAQIIHNNSLWMFPNVYPAMALNAVDPLHGRCKLVTAPRGTLSEWSLKHHSLQKKLFGWYAQYAALRATDMWHATCEKEYREIRALGYRQPVAIVPIGFELDERINSARGVKAREKKVVFFGRLHTVKAVDHLVLAWERIQARYPEWRLEIAGPDGGVRGELENLVRDHGIPRVSFVGEINGPAKYEFLASSEICVLPSHTENFGVTVAEALACETPVVASQGTPWSGLEANKAGRWVPIGPEPLADALKSLMDQTSEERRMMGLDGRDWMVRDFTWKSIGLKMKMAYEWLLNPDKVERPEWVMVG